jgi:hypothetical protein
MPKIFKTPSPPQGEAPQDEESKKILLDLKSLPKRTKWQYRIAGIILLAIIFTIAIIIGTNSVNPVNRTRRNAETAVVIHSADLIAAYADPENADTLYKNKYVKITGTKWLGYSADGSQIFHVWNGADGVNLHNPVVDIMCRFPDTKYYRDLSPQYGKTFSVTVVGKCVGLESGHVKLIDCVLMSEIEE